MAAALQAQEYARRSTMVSLSVPPTIPPLSIDDTFAALTRNFMAAWARMITGERDTITSGRFQVEGAREDGPRRCRWGAHLGAAARLHLVAGGAEPAPAAA